MPVLSRRRLLLLTACAVAGGSTRIAEAKPFELPRVDYSAERVVQGGDRQQSMRVRYSPGKERLDLTGSAAGGNVMIIRYDRGVTWVLMPQLRAYLELPVDVGAKLNALTRSLDLTPLGRETVNGVESTKHRVRGELDGHMWLSRDGIPMRIEGRATVDGQPVETRIEQRELAVARQDPAVFELPTGYSRIQINDPRMMQLLQQFMGAR